MSYASEAVAKSHRKLVGTPCAKCGKPRNAQSSYCNKCQRIVHYRNQLRRRGFIDADENTATTLLSKQGGVCAICYGRAHRWHLDHDHQTGKVRGVLCHQCNIMLGMARDSVTILENGARYLTGTFSALNTQKTG
jgi:hypothetical protein